jgi:hypothetical protein
MQMTTKQIIHHLSPASFILIMLLTGCYHTSETVQPPEARVEDLAAPSLAVVEPPAAAEPTVNPAAALQTATPPAVEVSTNDDKVSLASVEPTAKPEPAPSEVKPAPSKPKIDIRDPYNQAKPTLLGLTLNSPKDNVTARYGKPKEQFTMDEDNDPITVYDYTDFLVGFNKKNQLQFIDIRSADINPGLNGLKLGQSTSSVYEALGKPDSNTSFVLTYKSAGAVLKLDVNPKTNKVNSIKLFTVEG